MSTFAPREIRCRKCGDTKERSTALGVNIARSEEPRTALIARRFQVYTCDRCASRLVVEEPFTYIDLARKQFFVQHPRRSLHAWPTLEREAKALFARHYAPEALPGVVRGLGDGVRVRVVFGLEALREKVVAFEAGLEDVALEAVKVELARLGLEQSADEPWRLDAVTDASLRLMQAHGELHVPRADYARMLEEPYAQLRALIAGGAFVDVARLVPP